MDALMLLIHYMIGYSNGGMRSQSVGFSAAAQQLVQQDVELAANDDVQRERAGDVADQMLAYPHKTQLDPRLSRWHSS